MIRITLSAEFLVDVLTKSGQAMIISEGGLDGYKNKLVSIDHDTVKDHITLMFSDGCEEITDRTITITVPN